MEITKLLDMIIKEEKFRYLVLLVIISFTIIGCSSHNNEIDYIEVYAMEWYIFTRRSLDTEDVKNRKEEKLTIYKIDDERTLNLIKERIDQLKSEPGFTDIDVRMVCDIFFKDGSKKELAIGNTKLVKYKGEIFEKDQILVDLIEKTRPSESSDIEEK